MNETMDEKTLYEKLMQVRKGARKYTVKVGGKEKERLSCIFACRNLFWQVRITRDSAGVDVELQVTPIFNPIIKEDASIMRYNVPAIAVIHDDIRNTVKHYKTGDLLYIAKANWHYMPEIDDNRIIMDYVIPQIMLSYTGVSKPISPSHYTSGNEVIIDSKPFGEFKQSRDDYLYDSNGFMLNGSYTAASYISIPPCKNDTTKATIMFQGVKFTARCEVQELIHMLDAEREGELYLLVDDPDDISKQNEIQSVIDDYMGREITRAEYEKLAKELLPWDPRTDKSGRIMSVQSVNKILARLRLKMLVRREKGEAFYQII